MKRLDYIKTEQKSLETKLVDQDILSEIKKAYNKAKKRLIFLDYDGTLVGFNSNPELTKPDRQLTNILTKLTSEKKNKVVVISGRGRKTLENWLKPFDLDIIAEHGIWLKDGKKDWRTITQLTDTWKEEFMNVLEGYVDRTPGSFVEKKDYSLVWHYRKVETGLGEARTRELTSHLKYIANDKNLKVLEGNKVVEIKNSEVDKGKAAKDWLRKYKSDFIMACGDDWTDEDTFKVMPPESYTIKVGSTSSAAKYRVTDFEEIRSILESLT